MTKEQMKKDYGISDADYQRIIDAAEKICSDNWIPEAVSAALCEVYSWGKKSFDEVLKSNQEQKEILEGERKNNASLHQQLLEAKRPQFVDAADVSDECLSAILKSRGFRGTLTNTMMKILNIGEEVESRAAFYMVSVKGERNPTYQHATLDDAVKKAKRLAEITNKVAYILAPVSKVVPVISVTEASLDESDKVTDLTF